MGVFEKLKNALFEEEIVEVEEKPKKPKTKDFFKDRKVEKPIAKKVVLPEKREHKIEELDEEELLDEDFEIKPVQNIYEGLESIQDERERAIRAKLRAGRFSKRGY